MYIYIICRYNSASFLVGAFRIRWSEIRKYFAFHANFQISKKINKIREVDKKHLRSKLPKSLYKKQVKHSQFLVFTRRQKLLSQKERFSQLPKGFVVFVLVSAYDILSL